MYVVNYFVLQEFPQIMEVLRYAFQQILQIKLLAD